MPDQIKVLYIAGAGRTGSTLVEKLLGQSPAVFAGGELTFMWDYALRGRCSCGLPLRECPTWQAIFTEAYGGFSGVDANELVALRRRFNSVHLPLMLTERVRQRMLARLESFPSIVERLYHAIVATTGASVVVDSSKEPHYSYILRSRPALDVRVLHLVRDPRAVAHSWARVREQKGIPGSMMEVRSPAVSSAYYTVSNAATEIMWAKRTDRYLRVRYEDFVTDPIAVGREVSALVGEDIDLRAMLPDGKHGVVRGTHSAWGNPNRFDTGPVELRADDDWTRTMPARDRRLVTVLNAPFVRRYGYPARATHGASPPSSPSPATHPSDER